MFSGTSLDLECVSTGIPAPATHWTFNRTATAVRGEVFSIKSAISADSGLYTCTASNTIGSTKQTITVSVVSRAANDPSQSLCCTITEKAPTRAFSWLKEATTAFAFEDV